MGRVLARALVGGLVGHASGEWLVTKSVNSRKGCLMDVHPRGRYVVLHISVMNPGGAPSGAKATTAACPKKQSPASKQAHKQTMPNK